MLYKCIGFTFVAHLLLRELFCLNLIIILLFYCSFVDCLFVNSIIINIDYVFLCLLVLSHILLNMLHVSELSQRSLILKNCGNFTID